MSLPLSTLSHLRLSQQQQLAMPIRLVWGNMYYDATMTSLGAAYHVRHYLAGVRVVELGPICLLTIFSQPTIKQKIFSCQLLGSICSKVGLGTEGRFPSVIQDIQDNQWLDLVSKSSDSVIFLSFDYIMRDDWKHKTLYCLQWRSLCLTMK